MKQTSEAFVYLWYDAPNKMYYLGKHKGSPDDSYTHSSTIWESFTKDNIPEGVTRRILAYGTDEEMCVLESKLQLNRKERCWDRYYNANVSDGVYYGFGLGENNPQYKHGRFAGAKNNPEIYNIFALADRLHKSASEILQMPVYEFNMWCAYFDLQKEDQERQERINKMKR